MLTAVNPTDHSSIKIGAMSVATAPVRTARRVDRFTYAIRNIVTEEKSAARAARPLPQYRRPGAVRLRTRRTWSRPSPGPCATGTTTTPRRLALSKRAKVAADFARAAPVSPIACSSPPAPRGTRLALTAIVDEGESVLVPSPTYPLYTAVLAKIA